MEQDESAKKNSPKKRVSRKKKTQSLNLSAGDVNQPVPIEITDLIKDAFLRFQDTSNIKQSKFQDLEHMNNIVEEFLETFMILGYDLNGEKIFIMHAKNPHDKDALIEHLRTTLLNLVNREGNN